MDVSAELGMVSQVVTGPNGVINLISSNTILMVMFIASLVLIGFKIFKRAKRAAKA